MYLLKHKKSIVETTSYLELCIIQYFFFFSEKIKDWLFMLIISLFRMELAGLINSEIMVPLKAN